MSTFESVGPVGFVLTLRLPKHADTYPSSLPRNFTGLARITAYLHVILYTRVDPRRGNGISMTPCGCYVDKEAGGLGSVSPAAEITVSVILMSSSVGPSRLSRVTLYGTLSDILKGGRGCLASSTCGTGLAGRELRAMWEPAIQVVENSNQRGFSFCRGLPFKSETDS